MDTLTAKNRPTPASMYTTETEATGDSALRPRSRTLDYIISCSPPTPGTNNPLPRPGAFTARVTVTGATIGTINSVLLVSNQAGQFQPIAAAEVDQTTSPVTFTFPNFTNPQPNQPMTLVIAVRAPGISGSEPPSALLEVPFSFAAAVTLSNVSVNDATGTSVTFSVTNADSAAVTTSATLPTPHLGLDPSMPYTFTDPIAQAGFVGVAAVSVQAYVGGLPVGSAIAFSYTRIGAPTPTAPTVTVAGLDITRQNITVQFSEAMDVSTVTRMANYVTSGTMVTVSGNPVVIMASPQTVISVPLSGIPPANFTLTINPTAGATSVRNTAGTPLASPTNRTITV